MVCYTPTRFPKPKVGSRGFFALVSFFEIALWFPLDYGWSRDAWPSSSSNGSS
jgi:hypothetical protein